jgi:hypothetical protein
MATFDYYKFHQLTPPYILGTGITRSESGSFGFVCSFLKHKIPCSLPFCLPQAYQGVADVSSNNILSPRTLAIAAGKHF